MVRFNLGDLPGIFVRHLPALWYIPGIDYLLLYRGRFFIQSLD